MIVDSAAKDIVYSNYFTGIHGNYLKPSITKAGMDPDTCPRPIRRRWISTRRPNPAPRRGKTSGAPARASARSRRSLPVADLVGRLEGRRLHDTGRSAWWLLIGLVPLVGFLVLLWWFVQKGTDGSNEYGPDPLAGERA
jgi:hypothetical protein